MRDSVVPIAVPLTLTALALLLWLPADARGQSAAPDDVQAAPEGDQSAVLDDAPAPALDASGREAIDEVVSLRKRGTLLQTPNAISVVSREEILRARPALDLGEALDLVPGVFAQSSRNFAQDTRVSIRGFGSRARFGIRGVRVLVDGTPTTLPDGQSEVDSIDLAFTDRLEVVRSPISSLYGGGGGGILSFSTPPPTEESTFTLRSIFGTDHLARYEGLARGSAGGTGWVFGLARSRFSGYRDHARAEQTVLLGKLEQPLGPDSRLDLQFSSVWAPEGQDPGGLNAREVRADRTAARARARQFDTGEKLNQQKLALGYSRTLGEGRELRLRGYRLWRDFSNALPFGVGGRVDFDRTVTGGSVVYTDAWSAFRLMTGLDVDVQQDRRRRYVNDGGTRGDLTLRQSETVRSFGPFVEAELDFDFGLELVAGLRYDWTEFDVGDRFTGNGDQSDTIRFRELSPRFGAHWMASPQLHVYANVSTAFEVPSTVELRPRDGVGGFDSDRDPERSTGLELGAKGALGSSVLFDAAVFYTRVRDVLVPFDDEDETFWTNAGEVRRRGLELALSAALRPGATLRASYTWGRYRYHDFDRTSFVDSDGDGVEDTRLVEELDGRREPNNPEHIAAVELRLEHPSGLFAVFAVRHFSELEVDDANSAESAGATLSDARFGFDWERDTMLIRPFFGVRNWTKSEYNGTVRPNASFGRYFEPAPETQIYVGFEAEFVARDGATRSNGR